MTRSDISAGMFRPCGEIYCVVCDLLELPRGTHFITLPIPINRGELALFAVGDRLIIGRWYPGLAGPDSIQLPGLHIELAGEISVRIVGAVAPTTDPACALRAIKEQTR